MKKQYLHIENHKDGLYIYCDSGRYGKIKKLKDLDNNCFMGGKQCIITIPFEEFLCSEIGRLLNLKVI